MKSQNNSNEHQKVLPLRQLLEDLRSLPPGSSMTVYHGLLVLAALSNQQAAIKSLAEVLDAVMDGVEKSHGILNENFMSLLEAVEQLAALNGVSINKQVTVQDSTTEGENVITFPENNTKH